MHSLPPPLFLALSLFFSLFLRLWPVSMHSPSGHRYNVVLRRLCHCLGLVTLSLTLSCCLPLSLSPSLPLPLSPCYSENPQTLPDFFDEMSGQLWLSPFLSPTLLRKQHTKKQQQMLQINLKDDGERKMCTVIGVLRSTHPVHITIFRSLTDINLMP